jgi:hypothetical protein
MPRTRYRSKVQSIDESEARKIPGFSAVLHFVSELRQCVYGCKSGTGGSVARKRRLGPFVPLVLDLAAQ